MKFKLITSLLCLMIFQYAFSQIENINVKSRILEKTRQLKLQIPRNYDANSNKTYPLIIVFDGDYLFEPVAGIVDYLSYWEEIPNAFVLGINQVGNRMNDGMYDESDFLPYSDGARFYDFVQLEVMDYMKDNYNIGDFAVAIGHDYMANFINFFMFSEKLLFQGYINLSPDIANGLIPYVKEKLESSEDRIWYSLTTGTNDIEFLKEKTKKIYDELSLLKNDNISLSYKSFEKTNHYTFVVNALPYSLLNMFTPFTPIGESEYSNALIKSDDPVEYLINKYNLIKELYDVEEPIRVVDIMQVSRAIQEKEDWGKYMDLAKIARKEHPNTLLFDYFSGKYYQEIGNPQKAIKFYKTAYSYEEAGGITKDMLLDEAEKLKEIFGY